MNKTPGIASLWRGIVAAILLMSFAGCATQIKVADTMNPPPTEPFSAFQKIEILPIKMGAPYAGQEANDAALIKIQQNLDLRVRPLVEEWNKKGEALNNGRTLVIEPQIQDIKFINATSRVWAGAMAGSSAVVLKLRIYDDKTKTAVAEPVFFQRAAAMGGAFSFGATDNNMLVRIASLASDYLKQNYDKAVGGPTGKEEGK